MPCFVANPDIVERRDPGVLAVSESVRRGSCLCGAVQFEVTGEPFTMTYCHCESCRRWVGAPVHGGCLFHSEKVRVLKGADDLALFKRTEDSGSHRKFCRSCGSALFNDHPGIAMTDIMAVAIPDLVFEPKLHTNYAERVISIYDGLPKYKDFDPAVRGTGETIPE
jgi:hypothetical protein